MTHIVDELYGVIEERRDGDHPESYTAELLERGEDAALEKLGEEVTETVLAAKNDDVDALVHESADVIYHLLVVLAGHEVPIEDVIAELEERRG